MAKDVGAEPPRFTVDLSLEPQHRYDHIVPALMPAINRAKLTDIFEDLVAGFATPTLAKGVHRLARLCLRRVYRDEENAELQGICKATGIEMYLLVAFNVLLDLLLGCTSGGVRTTGPSAAGDAPASRMVLFRTLDWGMDPLRHLIVELEYVRSPGGPVVARTIGYFGYVGVLTGVREGLAISLNFRPHHDGSTRRKRASFRWHQLMVILGQRPSISSVLRNYLFSSPERPGAVYGQRTKKRKTPHEPEDPTSQPDVRQIISEIEKSPSTAAYLTFCTPQEVYAVEKDNQSAVIHTSSEFWTTCNHDASDELHPEQLREEAKNLAQTGMADIVEWSISRRVRVESRWKRSVAKRRRRSPEGAGVDLGDILRMLGDKEVTNEETHYAVVMDPEAGTFLWRRAYEAGEI